MNNQASRVAVVNQIARQLMHSGHPSEKEIRAQQDKLNTRYAWYQQCACCPHVALVRVRALAQLCVRGFLHRFTGLVAWMPGHWHLLFQVFSSMFCKKQLLG